MPAPTGAATGVALTSAEPMTHTAVGKAWSYVAFDRKSTRLNSSHSEISYAVFCLQNEPQLRDENAHNDKSVHGVRHPTYQAGIRRDADQPDIEAERYKRDEIEAETSYCRRRCGSA